MKRIIVQSDQGLIRAALLEDNYPIEYFIQRASVRQIVGNLYKGRVINVLPGMDASFVDIGQAKNAFLHVDDLLPANVEQQAVKKPSISELVKEGQELIVQVIKEPLGTKGARVTTHYSIPGRWLVYMPYADYVGVSRKINSEEERNRLKGIGESLRNQGEGIIVRTVAEGESEEALAKDLESLRKLWFDIAAQGINAAAPAEIYREPDILSRLVRDIFNDQVMECTVSDEHIAKQLRTLGKTLSPGTDIRIRLHREFPQDVFEYYGTDEAIERLFQHKVWLKNGGYVVVDQTEAMTIIDVNTGKFTGSVELEQTVFETNMEAADLVSQLIRLRDFGGIIIVDFIDMNREEHRQQIVDKLGEWFRRDRTKCVVIGWTRLGLLEITRKKVRESMDSQYFSICPQCGGNGKLFQR